MNYEILYFQFLFFHSAILSGSNVGLNKKTATEAFSLLLHCIYKLDNFCVKAVFMFWLVYCRLYEKIKAKLIPISTHVNKSSRVFSLSLRTVLGLAAISHSIFGRQEFRIFADNFNDCGPGSLDLVDWVKSPPKIVTKISLMRQFVVWFILYPEKPVA